MRKPIPHIFTLMCFLGVGCSGDTLVCPTVEPEQPQVSIDPGPAEEPDELVGTWVYDSTEGNTGYMGVRIIGPETWTYKRIYRREDASLFLLSLSKGTWERQTKNSVRIVIHEYKGRDIGVKEWAVEWSCCRVFEQSYIMFEDCMVLLEEGGTTADEDAHCRGEDILVNE